MPQADYPHALEVEPKALDAARKRLAMLLKHLKDEDLMAAALREMWLDDASFYDEAGNLQVALTDMQLIGFTYALAAWMWRGNHWDGEVVWGGQFTSDEYVWPRSFPR